MKTVEERDMASKFFSGKQHPKDFMKSFDFGQEPSIYAEKRLQTSHLAGVRKHLTLYKPPEAEDVRSICPPIRNFNQAFPIKYLATPNSMRMKPIRPV